MTFDDIDKEPADAEILREIASNLRRRYLPVSSGIYSYHIEFLEELATKLMTAVRASVADGAGSVFSRTIVKDAARDKFWCDAADKLIELILVAGKTR